MLRQFPKAMCISLTPSKAVITMRYDNDTTIPLDYDGTEVIEITMRLRSDYDPTTTYRARLQRDSTRAKN